MSDQTSHFATKEEWKAYWIADEERRGATVSDMRQSLDGQWWFIDGNIAWNHPGGGLCIRPLGKTTEWLLPENERWRKQ